MGVFYVSTTGSSANDGSESEPWSLAWAVSASNTDLQVAEEHTVWIADGTYTTVPRLDAYAAGTGTGARIHYRAINELVPIIDSGLRAFGDHCWFWQLTFAFVQSTARESAQSGSEPTDIDDRWKAGFFAFANDVRAVQCVLRDGGNGFVTNATQSGEAYLDECYVYNNGWIGTDRAHGHGAYIQSDVALGRKAIRNSVFWASYYHLMQIYGSDATVLTGFDIEENAAFEGGLAGGETVTGIIYYGATEGNLGDIHFRRNSVRKRIGTNQLAMSLGAGTVVVEDATLDENVIEGPVNIDDTEGLTVTDNIFASGGALPVDNHTFGLKYAPPYTTHDFARNAYYKQAADSRDIVFRSGFSTDDLSAWRTDTGLAETDSSFTENASGAPTVARALVWPSRHTTGRAHIYVWNWPEDATVNADLSAVLAVGQRYEIRHVFDHATLGAALVTAVYDGDPVAFPMTAKTPPTPYGGSALPEMDNTFGVFVVRLAPEVAVVSEWLPYGILGGGAFALLESPAEEAAPEHSGLLCPRVLVDDTHTPAVLVQPRYTPRVLVHYRCSP